MDIPEKDFRDLAALLASWRDTVLVPPVVERAWIESDSLAEEGAALFKLLAPNQVVPGTAMRDNQLWKEEARALTFFLVTRK